MAKTIRLAARAANLVLTMTERETEHEYVEYMLDVKDGQIVGCKFFGEGRQVEPLTEPVLFKPLDGNPLPREWQRIERRIKLAIR